ncbi:MAG TPA: RNA-binding domain-containing protein [Candidatus Bathyarchaeia archaeon]|nr:RNA-binding domain-containing protein [Candidatus Bathyarchaeia archaeon]
MNGSDRSCRPKKAIHSISVTVFAHATENESKVLAALRLIVPEHVSVDRLPVTGHFGNPMVILTARTEKASETRRIISAIKQKLPKDELMELREEIPQHLSQRCMLVMKFDKQAAARGFLQQGKEDPIVLRAKIAAYPARVKTATQIARDLFNDA